MLTVDESGITVRYSDGAGAYYSAVTFNQLFTKVGVTLPFMTITDYPGMEIRGYAIDMARDRTLTVQATKDLIDELSAMKLNYFYIYLNIENIECELFESAQKKGAGWTIAECNEIAEYCEKNYVTLVPFFELMGHCEELLASPKFRKYAEIPESPWTLCLQDPEAEEFARDIVSLLNECFHPEYIMIGGDESYDLGTGRSKDFMPDSSVLEIYLDSLTTLHDLLSEQGIKMMYAHDMLVKYYLEGRRLIPEAMSRMKDAVCFLWEYEVDSTFECSDYFDEWGLTYWIMPSSNTYSTIAGRLSDSEKNINAAVNVVNKKNLPGIMLAHFGDGGQLNHTVAEFNEIAYSASVCWNSQKGLNNTDAYVNYVGNYIFGSSAEVTESWEELQRFNDLLGRSWGCSWLVKIVSDYISSDVVLEDWLRFCPYEGTEKIQYCIEQLQQVIARAERLRTAVETAPLAGKNGQAYGAEMHCTANEIISYATTLIFRLKLYGKLASYEDLKEEALRATEFNEALFIEYAETWKYLSGDLGIFGHSIKNLAASFHLPAIISGKYIDGSASELFLKTVNDLASGTDFDPLSVMPGYVWMGYGAGVPTVTVCNIKSGSSNEIDRMFTDGSLTVMEGLSGVEGKALRIDPAAMIANNHYRGTESVDDCLKPVVLFPGFFNGNGTYRITLRMKTESKASVEGKITLSVLAFCNANVEPTLSVEYGEQDSDGWMTVTVTFDNDRSLEYFSFGTMLHSNIADEVLYIADLSCKKIA